MWESTPVVAVFGSSSAVDGREEYKQAYSLGKLLAGSGFAVCNGGYKGLMEATSRGAAEASGATIGLTLGIFGHREANPYIMHEIHSATLFERLEKFVNLSEAFIVLKGGVGTLAEAFAIWNLMQTHALGPRPFIFLGEFWPELIEHISFHMEIRKKDMQLLHFASMPEQAIEILRKYLKVKT